MLTNTNIFSSLLIFLLLASPANAYLDVPVDDELHTITTTLQERNILDPELENFYHDLNLTRAESIKIILEAFNLNPPTYQDLDNDGLSNFDENIIGTDPLNADTDEDGFTDLEEIQFGYDPLTPSQKSVYLIKFIFSDLSIDQWYFPYFRYAIHRNIIKGYSDNTIKPDGSISRIEFLKILLETSSIPLQDKLSPVAYDLTRTHWGHKYAFTAQKYNLPYLITNDFFYPDQSITRREAIYWLYYLLDNNI